LIETEDLELGRYPRLQDQALRQSPQQKRQREKKLRKLLEQDDMKFSHSIQFNAVPDWSTHYIAYSNLKKLYVFYLFGFD
jgi:phosphate transporter